MDKIEQENAIIEDRADSSYWDVPHSTEIEGFATDMSVNAGNRVDFKINVNGGAGSDYKADNAWGGDNGVVGASLYDNQNDIGNPARPLEQLVAQSSFPGQMRQGQVARHRAGALSHE